MRDALPPAAGATADEVQRHGPCIQVWRVQAHRPAQGAAPQLLPQQRQQARHRLKAQEEVQRHAEDCGFMRPMYEPCMHARRRSALCAALCPSADLRKRCCLRHGGRGCRLRLRGGLGLGQRSVAAGDGAAPSALPSARAPPSVKGAACATAKAGVATTSAAGLGSGSAQRWRAMAQRPARCPLHARRHPWATMLAPRQAREPPPPSRRA